MSKCAIFIVASYFLCLVLQHFFGSFVGVLASATLGGTKKYV